MGTEFNKDVDVNTMEDSGNSCGSSVVSDYSGPSDHSVDFDADGVQVSDIEGENPDYLQLSQCDDATTYVDYFLDNMEGRKPSPPPLLTRPVAGLPVAEPRQPRLAVLGFEQVRRLNDVMDEVVQIHGRGNFPTLEVRLRELVGVVRRKLEADPAAGGAGMRVRDIRLNGGGASHVLSASQPAYNDIDLIFGVELANGRNFDRVKAAVLGSLYDMLPDGVSRKRMSTCSLKEAYVGKMVKVNSATPTGDRWSLISLGSSRGRGVELKFVDSMRRQYEFSVDSFQIVLDSLLRFYECSAPIAIGENFYPSVVGDSVYGDFDEAFFHLEEKLISTRHPEEIRGGGLLKYCNLLVKNYRPSSPEEIKSLQKYMCSRFFIDFPDIGQQKAKLENYLWNHFVEVEEEALKYQYLMLLHDVVEESTVCLMGHERRQTLQLIKGLAWQVLYQDQQRLMSQHAAAAPPPLMYANGIVYAPIMQTNCYCTCSAGGGWVAAAPASPSS